MKICIITTQLLGQEKVGGFGTMAKQMALSLQKEGKKVVLLMPQHFAPKSRASTVENDCIPFKIIYIKKQQLFDVSFYRAIDADIYHSQHQTLLSSMALLAEPNKKHIVTCIDPRNWRDWLNEFKNATWIRRLKIPFNYLIEESLIASWAVRKADLVTVPAEFLVKKVRKMYSLQKKPLFLPLLEAIPTKIPAKSKTPTVLWIGRLAKRKSPETFIRLAAQFPKVTFWLMGKAEEKGRRKYLHELAAKYPNVKMLGFKDKFEDPDFFDYLNKSWILINTASREGLPLTFVEAASRGCAILSGVNPDNYALRFGFWAEDRNFEEGLRYLLQDDKWREKGESAHQYVHENNRENAVIRRYLNMYSQLLDAPQFVEKELLPVGEVSL